MKSSLLSLRLRALRKEKNLTQLDVARRVRISNTTLSQYESGKRLPSFDILRQLAEIFGCSADYLLGFTEQRELLSTAPALTAQEILLLENIKSTNDFLFSELLALSSLNERDMQIISQILTAFVNKKHA